MLLNFIYPWIFIAVWALFGVFLGMLILRLIFNYSDPNPFGSVGRFGYKVRKVTEKWVYPGSRFLATFRVDTRLAPLVTMLIAFIFTYFAMQIVSNTFFVIDGLTAGVLSGNVRIIVGFILYGMLSLLVLLIFIRFISQWFVFHRNTFLGFVARVTDPILLPARRLIPPIGMFDISAMLVLLLISFLQSIVMRAFVY
jgi:YggT family protein